MMQELLNAVMFQGRGPKGSKLSWELWWRAVMQLQAEAVVNGRACDLLDRPGRRSREPGI